MSELELSHVVVAGGAGFIGSAFARNYLAWHPRARSRNLRGDGDDSRERDSSELTWLPTNPG